MVPFQAASWKVYRAYSLAIALCLLSACQSTPKTADDFHLEGLLQVQHHNLPKALENLDQAVMLESSNPVILVNRGLVYSELGNYEAAIADYTAAIEHDNTLSEAYYNRANAHHNLKQYEAAVADYSQAIKQKQDFAYAYANRAIDLEALGRVDEAIADLTQAKGIFERNDQNIDVKKVSDQIEQMRLKRELPADLNSSGRFTSRSSSSF